MEMLLSQITTRRLLQLFTFVPDCLVAPSLVIVEFMRVYVLESRALSLIVLGIVHWIAQN
jgi:hypothetical protein